jgi:hypothetical protein
VEQVEQKEKGRFAKSKFERWCKNYIHR